MSSEKNSKASLDNRGSDSFHEHHHDDVTSTENINAKLANPLAGIPQDQLLENATKFAQEHDLAELTTLFQKGALVAQNPLAFEELPLLDADDRAVLQREIANKWDQPKMLYYLVVLCSLAAAVQGVSRVIIPSSPV